MSYGWLLYYSAPRVSPWPSTILDIARSAEANNAANGLCGVLLYSSEVYLQYAEGPLDPLSHLARRLSTDDRHEIRWAIRGGSDGMRLEGLPMGYIDADHEAGLLADEPLWARHGTWQASDAEDLADMLLRLALRKYPSTLAPPD